MKMFEARASMLRAEMQKGNGDGASYSFPVSLEPAFTPYDYGAIGRKIPHLPSSRPERAEPFTLSFARINPSLKDDFKSAQAEQILIALNPSRPLGLDIVGCSEGVELQLSGTLEDIQAAIRQISAHYLYTEVFLATDWIKEIIEHLKYTRSYRMKESYLFPIKAGHPVDPYTALLGGLHDLPKGECALFQVLFIPAKHDWAGNILRLSRHPWDPSKSAFVDLPQLPKTADNKAATPMFAVAVRLAASSQKLLDRLEGSFLAFFSGEENGLTRRAEACPVENILARVSFHHGMILNARELAGLVHFPDPDHMPESLLMAAPGAPAPPLARRDILVPLGGNRHRGIEVPVGISEEWLTRHVAIFGASGSGKSTLLSWFLRVIYAGYGLAFLDPAGDTAEWFLRLIPRHRVSDTIYLNFGDRDFPPALNVLEASDQREREILAGELLTSLKRLFHGSSEFGPRMEWILRQAIRTLLLCSGEKTLRDIPWLLGDQEFRTKVLETIHDPDILDFWNRVFPHFPAGAADPILNRLSHFLDDPLVRNIVAQPNRIDFHRVLREGKVLICNLSKGTLGEEPAILLGSFILSRLQLAAMARAEVPTEERLLFPILVDEFQNYGGT